MRKSVLLWRLVGVAAAISFCCALAWADQPGGGEAILQAVKGEVVTESDGTITAETPVTLAIGPAPGVPYRFEAQVQLSEQGGAGDCRLVLSDPEAPQSTLALVGINRDREGHRINVVLQHRDGQTDRLVRTLAAPFAYWPTGRSAAAAQDRLKAAGIGQRSWRGRWISLQVDVDAESVQAWLDGQFVGTITLPSAWQCAATLTLGKGD